MSRAEDSGASFSRWLAQPQSLIALAAVLLSLCGLFIAVYEANLIRRQQRISVWPYVEVSASVSARQVQLWVRNSGVGPARVQAAAVSRDGEVLGGWADLIRGLGLEVEQPEFYHSRILGRVLPRDSEREIVFRVRQSDSSATPELVQRLRREILGGAVDVTLCYCSVYDDCWTASLQELLGRTRGVATSGGERAVDGCETAPRSGI